MYVLCRPDHETGRRPRPPGWNRSTCLAPRRLLFKRAYAHGLDSGDWELVDLGLGVSKAAKRSITVPLQHNRDHDGGNETPAKGGWEGCSPH